MFLLLVSLLGLEIGGMKMIKPAIAPETLCYTMSIASGEEGSSIYMVSEEKFKERNAVKLTTITTLGHDTSAFYDTITLFIDLNTFEPLMLKRAMRGKFSATITGDYQKDKVKVHLETKQGEKKFNIKREKGAVDNDEIVYILRWLDLKGPKKGTLTDITPAGGTTIKVNWEYAGDTTITISGKGFKAYNVKLNFLGRTVSVYYEKELPRRMLKYIDVSSGTKMTLRLD